jgi:hypothetical protein
LGFLDSINVTRFARVQGLIFFSQSIAFRTSIEDLEIDEPADVVLGSKTRNKLPLMLVKPTAKIIGDAGAESAGRISDL